MSDDDNVVRMVDVRNGTSPPDLREWAAAQLESSVLDPGAARSVVVIVERFDGVPFVVGQSIQPMCGIRLVGLLQHVIHRILHQKPMGLP